MYHKLGKTHQELQYSQIDQRQHLSQVYEEGLGRHINLHRTNE